MITSIFTILCAVLRIYQCNDQCTHNWHTFPYLNNSHYLKGCQHRGCALQRLFCLLHAGCNVFSSNLFTRYQLFLSATLRQTICQFSP